MRKDGCRPPWGNVFALLTVVLAMRRVTSQITSLQTYPLDWAVVPTTPPTSRNLTTDCICDLLNIGCTLGCCCDSNCPPDVSAIFEDQRVCLPSGTEQQTLKFCVPNGFVAKVNLPSNGDFYQIPVEQANTDSFFAQLLCIVSDSNPKLGDNYPDPPEGDTSENVRLAQCPAATSPPTTNQDNYPFQGYVYVQRSGKRQPLRVPFPAFSAACNDQYIVGFLLPTPARSSDYYTGCQRDLTALNLSAECAGSGLLTAQYFSTLQFYPDLTSTATQAFTIVTVQYLNATTGVLSAARSTTPSYDTTTNTCRNVMRYMNITFYYTPSGTDGYIDRAEMTFVLTDVNSSSTPFNQGVRVAWIDSTQDSIVQFAASGNPGYRQGFPILAGTLVTDPDNEEKNAINRFVGGLPVAAPGMNGECSPTSLTFIGYGTNTSSACSISLTAAQLRDFCTNEQDNPAKYLAFVMSSFYPAISEDNLYIGVWGNAEFNSTNDWVQAGNAGSPSNRTTYSPSDNACIGVITGFDLQIVTGVAFSSNNLQRKILYANLCLKTSTWDFPEELSTNATQRFYLEFDVSFIPLPQEAESVKKPAPPLVVYLPADIFFPFVISDSGVASARVSVWFALFGALLVFLAQAHLRHA